MHVEQGVGIQVCSASKRVLAAGGRSEQDSLIVCLAFREPLGPCGNLPGGASDKEATCQCRRHGFDPWVGKIPWRRRWHHAPVSLPGKFHRQRSLVGCIPRGCRESDTAAPTHTHKVPAGPVAKTPHSQGRGVEFHPWSGN